MHLLNKTQMKFLLSIPILSVSFFVSAQVGIGTTTVAPSEVLKVSSTNKGILLPKLKMPSPNTNVLPAINPKRYMIAFNNSDIDDENGFYYTYEKSLSPTTLAWKPFLDINTINNRLIVTKNHNYTATNGVWQNTGTGGAVPYTIGENPTVRPWLQIPGGSKTINYTKNNNETSIYFEGMIQDNNSGFDYSENSYAIGLFVDGKLHSVRTFVLTAPINSECAYDIFSLKSNVYNLPAGNHTFSVYAITRAQLSGDANTLTFGIGNNGCSLPAGWTPYLSNDMTRLKVSVQIQEF